jgi:hypothetical protein
MIRMKVRCEKCGTEGQLQHIGKNYYRVKHYLGSVDGKLSFEYHKQSLEYVTDILDIGKERRSIDPIDQKNIDPKLLKNSFVNESEGRGSLAWLGRQTHNLEFQTGPCP